MYGIAEDKLSIGFVIGLDHTDAKLDPHALFVQWKQIRIFHESLYIIK